MYSALWHMVDMLYIFNKNVDILLKITVKNVFLQKITTSTDGHIYIFDVSDVQNRHPLLTLMITTRRDR